MTVQLPKNKRKPKENLEDYIILIYGPPKIGKSTLASQFEEPLFLATEAGLNSLKVYDIPISKWDNFLEACAIITKKDHQFRTIIIDTTENLWQLCSEYIRKKHGFEHESDLDYGKGWSLVKDEFSRVITKLSLLPYGLVMISHANEIEIKTRTASWTKAIPNLNKSGREVVLGMTDIILYCEVTSDDEGEKRVMRTKPSENWEAGDRTGRLPKILPLGYKYLHNAFYGNNKNDSKNKKGGKK